MVSWTLSGTMSEMEIGRWRPSTNFHFRCASMYYIIGTQKREALSGQSSVNSASENMGE